MLKIEDVKVGDELVCIDREGMLCNERLPEAWREYMYKQDKFIVNSIYKNCIVYLDGLKMQITAINGIEKYFKKKEQSQQYTFNQLQDTAHKAVVDGVLSAYSVDFDGHTNYIKLSFDGKFTDYNDTCNDSGIRFIQSLYKETFVIESEEDIKRIRVDAIVTLTNEIKVYAKEVSDNWINAPLINSLLCNSLNYVSLKGATVEQERGRDD